MDYSKLTNPELDKLIAEKRGFHRIDYRENDGTISLGAVPHYSTDPHYAMELLKEMAEHHVILSYEKNWNLMPDDQNMYWIVHFPLWLNFIRIQRILTYADTPERAIAEAWLQWSENERI